MRQQASSGAERAWSCYAGPTLFAHRSVLAGWDTFTPSRWYTFGLSFAGVATPFRWLVVLLLEGNAPVTFSVNHRPDSTGFYTLPGTLTSIPDEPTSAGTPSRTDHPPSNPRRGPAPHAHRCP